LYKKIDAIDLKLLLSENIFLAVGLENFKVNLPASCKSN
jgi:hypothetical protein